MNKYLTIARYIGLASVVVVGFNNCSSGFETSVRSSDSLLGQISNDGNSTQPSVDQDSDPIASQPSYVELDQSSFLGVDIPLTIDTDQDGVADQQVDPELLAEEVLFLAMTYDDYQPLPTDNNDTYNIIKPAILNIEHYLEKQKLIGQPGESCAAYLQRLEIIASGLSATSKDGESVTNEFDGRCASLVFNDLTKQYSCSTSNAGYVSPFVGTDKDGIERHDIFVPICRRADNELIITAIGAGSIVPNPEL